MVRNRQYDLTVVLENVHDPHNIGAVIRTCDAVGIGEIYVIYTEPELQQRGIIPGHKSSSGSRKWIKIHYHRSLEDAVEIIRSKYGKILGTHFGQGAGDLYEMDWTQSVALAFGNEHDGISKELIQQLDGHFAIPQKGFVQSLNISVACAVSLYEVYRQRFLDGRYDRDFGEKKEDQAELESYVRIHHRSRTKGRME